MVRFLVVAIITYFILRFVWGVIAAGLRKTNPPSPSPPEPPAQPANPPEEYRDVHDAKYIDMDDKTSDSAPRSDS